MKPIANGAGCHAFAEHPDAAASALRPPRHDIHPESVGTIVGCAVLGYGGIRATDHELADLRQNPGSYPARPIPPSFLKHADEQTVVAMAALLQAIDRHDLTRVDFTDWGVLAAPRFLGRITTIHALERFRAEGAWGISPHLIPHRTLHAISGTISQALQIHGPNLGVGGGPDATLEVMRVAAAFLADPVIPGLWVVMSGWDLEPSTVPQVNAPLTNSRQLIPHCQAVALALAPSSQTGGGSRMNFHLGPPGSNGYRPSPAPLLTLESLLMALDGLAGSKNGQHGHADACWSLPNAGWVELRLVGAGAEMKS